MKTKIEKESTAARIHRKQNLKMQDHPTQLAIAFRIRNPLEKDEETEKHHQNTY